MMEMKISKNNAGLCTDYKVQQSTSSCSCSHRSYDTVYSSFNDNIELWPTLANSTLVYDVSNLVFQDTWSSQHSFHIFILCFVLFSSTHMKTKTNKKDLVENCDRTFRHDDNLDWSSVWCKWLGTMDGDDEGRVMSQLPSRVSQFSSCERDSRVYIHTFLYLKDSFVHLFVFLRNTLKNVLF